MFVTRRRSFAASSFAGLGLALLLGLAAYPTPAEVPQTIDTPLGSIRIPQPWNGTLLLYSHGYLPAERAPDLAPTGTVEWLLSHGYALAAARYSAAGWAVAEAVPDQIALRDAFVRQFGQPRRTIAWGSSMGGLITVALAELHPDLIDAALPSCGSLAGTLGMMNQALDGAFAFKILLGSDAGIRLVGIVDDPGNAQRVELAADGAMQTPIGRARLALAMAVAQLPASVGEELSTPSPLSAESRRRLAHEFSSGVFLPRHDQEMRAHGVYSWNTGIDYGSQLARSGRLDWVRSLYRAAHASLPADLQRLRTAPRIVADPAAIAYMRLHYVPSGDLKIPVFSYHTLGDALTVATQQSAYAGRVRAAGHSSQLRLGWVEREGHCTFTPGEHLAALHELEVRLQDGRWRGRAGDAVETPFTRFHSPAFLRPCGLQRCVGEPAARPPRPSDP